MKAFWAIAFIAAIIYWIYCLWRQLKEEGIRVGIKLQEKEHEIRLLINEYEKWKAAKRMVDIQIDRIFLALKISFIGLILLIDGIIIIYTSGYWLMVILESYGAICVLYHSWLFLARKQMCELNTITRLVYGKLKVSLYKAYNIEITHEKFLYDSIVIKKAELQALK